MQITRFSFTVRQVFQTKARIGVNYGGRGNRPQNLEWGTLMQIVPSDFVMFQNFKDQIASTEKLSIFLMKARTKDH